MWVPKEDEEILVNVRLKVKQITYNGERVSVSGMSVEKDGYGGYFILGVPMTGCSPIETSPNGD